MWGKEKLLKSISYNNIASVSYKIKPANTAIGWIITILYYNVMNQKANENSKIVMKNSSSRNKKILTGCLAVVVLIVVFIGTTIVISSFIGSSLSVDDVKKSQLDGYDNITIGKAFDNYFENESWEEFQSDSGMNIVEFQGDCQYAPGEISPLDIHVTVQFVQDPDIDEDYFYIYGMWLDVTDENANEYMKVKNYSLSDIERTDFIYAIYNNNNNNYFSDFIFGP